MTMATLPVSITLTALRTKRDDIGHDPRAPYIERFWLPILGPTAIFLARLAAYGFDTTDTYSVDTVDLAHALGIRTPSRLSQAMHRLGHFELATHNENQWTLRAEWPWLDYGYVRNLTEPLKTEHRQWVEAFNTQHPNLAGLRAAAEHLDEHHRKNSPPHLINEIVRKQYAHLAAHQLAAISRNQPALAA
jgi:hypothetical protein